MENNRDYPTVFCGVLGFLGYASGAGLARERERNAKR